MKTPLYTPSQLARTVGVTPSAIRARLAGVEPGAGVLVRGVAAGGYALDRLPGGLIAELTAAWHSAESLTGARPWRDLAHFLSDPPPVIDRVKPEKLAVIPPEDFRPDDFAPLVARLGNFADPTSPTRNEVATLWHDAFGLFAEAVEQGRNPIRFKRALIRWLARHARFLAPRETLVRKYFNRLYTSWIQSGGNLAALKDRRADAQRQRRAPKLSDSDRDTLERLAVFQFGGNSTKAIRHALQNRLLSDEICDRYTAERARIGDAPKNLMSQINGRVKLLYQIHVRPRHFKMNGAGVRRDWSSVGAGDVYSFDDLTSPVYFRSARNELTRGQVLMAVDCRSKRILGFVLREAGQYNAETVFCVFMHAFQEAGCPRKGLQLECGLWKSSKLLHGERAGKPFAELQTGLAERFGIQVWHASPGNARAKIIENVFKLVQDEMHAERGYVGRNEMVVKHERVQAQKRREMAMLLRAHRNGETPPASEFLTAEEWIARLEQIAERYNATPQDSRVMGGNEVVRLSPDEAWERYQPRDEAGRVEPMQPVSIEMRHLLAAAPVVRPVTAKGITLRGRTYLSEATGEFIGKKVLARFNPAEPDLITFEDITDGSIFAAPQAPTLAPFDASCYELQLAASTIKSHTAPIRLHYSRLKKGFQPPQRQTFADRETVNRCVDTQRALESARAERKAEEKRAKFYQDWNRGGRSVSPGDEPIEHVVINRPPRVAECDYERVVKTW